MNFLLIKKNSYMVAVFTIKKIISNGSLLDIFLL